MNELKWMSWNEWNDMKELKWRNWNEWIEINELTWVTCQKWSETCFFLRVLCDQLLGDDVVDICAFCRPHLPKGLSGPQFFNMFKWKSSSRYSIVHILSTSSSKSAPSPSVFLTFSIFKWKSSSRYSLVHFCRPHLPKVLQTRQFLLFLCEIELSLQSRAPFADLIFQSCSGPLSSFTVFIWNRASRYSPVSFLWATFPDRAAHLRKQRPSFGDHGSHDTRKNTGFRARECFQAWIHTFRTLTVPNYLHDDVVAMMIEVTVMERKLAMTIVRNSEVS